MDLSSWLNQLLEDVTSRGALAGAASVLIIVLALGGWWWWTRLVERGRVETPFVILVTGSRGKSSVVRMIHSVALQAGIPAYAKMTGTAAAEITSADEEIPTYRLGQVSVLEMLGTMRRALRSHPRPKVLVLECMAVSPELVSLISERMVRPDIVVITNTYLDHLEEQGSTSEQIAEALSEAMLPGSTVITAEDRPGPLLVLENRAREVGAPFISVTEAGVDAETLGHLKYAHPQNVAIVYEVGRLLGISDADIEQGIFTATHEPGESELWQREMAELTVNYVDLGAINDPPSLLAALNAFPWPGNHEIPRIAWLTGRWDRPLRALAFAGCLRTDLFDAVIINGGAVHAVRKVLIAGGWSPDRLSIASYFTWFAWTWRRRFARLASTINPHAQEIIFVSLENEHDALAERGRAYFHAGSRIGLVAYTRGSE